MNCGFNIDVIIKDASITFTPTFKEFVDVLSMILNSLYDAVTVLPRVDIKLEFFLDTVSPESLKVYDTYII